MRLLWIIAGIILVILIARRLNRDPEEPASENFYGSSKNRFRCDHEGIFNVKVVALEFNETGPVMFVNGVYNNLDEHFEVSAVTADVIINGSEEMFVSFEPVYEDRSSEKRIGDLVNFYAPVSFEPYQRGMFRAPLLSPEREERLAAIIDRLDDSAERMVDKYDREFESYSLEGESLEKLELDFKRDFVVKGIAEEIKREFTWSAGEIRLYINLLTHDDEVVEGIPITLSPNHQDISALESNIDSIVINSLRAGLDLPQAHYNSIVYER